MSIRDCVRAVALFSGCIFAGPLLAGNPTGLFTNPDALTFTSPALNTGSVTQTFTVGLLDNGNQGEGSKIGTFSFNTGNPQDFAIVGGTCIQNTTVLDDTVTPTCTVIVQYTPSTTGSEQANFNATCTSVGLPGGFSINCDGTSGQLGLVFGSILAILTQQAPALDPKLLTLLATMVMGMGAYFAARKSA